MIQGVSEADVTKRRQQFGYNELESPHENLLLKFFGFFTGPILYGEHSLMSAYALLSTVC